MATLHLTLKKKWFDMIASGQKKEEYRECKPYWERLIKKTYDKVIFRNGYQPNSPQVTVEIKKTVIGLGIIEWGAPEKELVYIIRLGKIIERKNC